MSVEILAHSFVRYFDPPAVWVLPSTLKPYMFATGVMTVGGLQP